MADTPADTPLVVLDAASDAAASGPPADAAAGVVICAREGCGRVVTPPARLGGSPKRFCSKACRVAVGIARAKHAVRRVEPSEIPPVTSLEEALTALDSIRVGILTGRVTPSAGRAASGAVAEWVRAHSALQTAKVVNELRSELEAKTREIAVLREQLTTGGALRVAR